MPLIKEIENVRPFIAELPKRTQKDLIMFMSQIVVSEDNAWPMRWEEQNKLTEQENKEFQKRIRKFL